MTPAIRTLPIVRAMRVARGWFVALPAGNLFAESEAQVRSMVARHAPGSVVMFLGQNPQRDAAEVAAVRKIRLSRAAAVRDGAAAANSSVRLSSAAADLSGMGMVDSQPQRRVSDPTQRANGTRTAPDGRSRTAHGRLGRSSSGIGSKSPEQGRSQQDPSPAPASAQGLGPQ